MSRQRPQAASDLPPVLLVDDTPANLMALAAVVSPLALRVVTAPSGSVALKILEREAFAVALIDVQMPEMDGFELTRRLRGLENGRELPVLFVTAIHGDEAYVRRGYASGAADYITKPYDPEVVRARVKAFVDLYTQREAVRRGQVALRTQERDEAVRRLVALERIATAVLETTDLHMLLEELLRAFIDAAEVADFAVVLLRDGQQLTTAATVGLDEEATHHASVPFEQGFAGRVAAERRPLELSDPDGTLPVQDTLARRRVNAVYGLPLMHGGEVLGVAQIGSSRANSFSDAEKRLFAAAADRAALAVAKYLQLSDLHHILSAAPAHIAIVRVPSLEYTFANPAYRGMLHHDLVGSATLEERGLGAEALAAVLRVSRTGESVLIEELPVTAALANEASRVHYFRFSAQPLRNAAGSVERVLMFLTDVTPQVEARQEIEATHAMRAELLERERTARKAAELASIAKDDFLAAVSHELRTPLNAILGWASLARAQKVPDLDRALAVIERNALAQARIVEDVLDFSRIARGKMRLALGSVDISLVALEALETVRPAAEAKGITLDVDLDVRRKLMGDSQRLQQVAWNLLTNAIKFTKTGGRVEVRAHEGLSTVVLSVKDTGQGIDVEFLPYVFEPFRQASSGSTRAHGGLGLGLAIVKQIVLAHGGSVRVESGGLGLGATFILEFPVEATHRDVPAVPATAPAPAADGPSIERLRVLVVDDDEDSREFLNCALTQRGATVVTASGAAEALRELESFRPDVLVSDIAMPEADGYTLMRRVRALPPEMGGAVPAVALTAHSRKDAWEHARAAGFQLLEAKPVDLDHLTASIASVAFRGEPSRAFGT